MDKMDLQFRRTARLIYILLPVWSGFLISGLSGLRSGDVTLVVPEVILRGETLIMDCRFPSNESSSVYSVQWYKGTREFFRYTPHQYPKTKVIHFSDINIQVDENQSDMNKIVVKDVPAAFRGNISCEVTTEPNYKTVLKTSYLLVAVPPEQDPTLTVDVIKKNPYENGSTNPGTWQTTLRTKSDDSIVTVGDTIVARCTAGPSTPGVDLKFEINDHSPKLYRGVIIDRELKDVDNNKSILTIATMNLTLQHDTFNLATRKVNLKCLANLYHLYNASSLEVIKELPRESSVTASSYGLGGNGSQRLHFGFGTVLFLLLSILNF